MEGEQKQASSNNASPQSTVTPSIFSSEVDPLLSKKTSRTWKVYFVILSLCNINTLASVVGVLWLSSQAASGASGTEFIALIFLPGLYGGVVLALLNILTIPIYLKHYRKGAVAWAISGLIILASMAYLVWAVPGVIKGVQARKDFPKERQQAQAQFEAKQRQYQQAIAPQAISLANATTLIDNCQIHQYYETPSPVISSSEDADNSSTGIYLISLPNTGPWRITAGKKTESQLTPIVDAAESKCAGLPYLNNDTAN